MIWISPALMLLSISDIAIHFFDMGGNIATIVIGCVTYMQWAKKKGSENLQIHNHNI
jgi:hypothetical protein